MPRRFPRRTIAVAAAVAAALTVSTPAMAAGKKPKPQAFTAQGLVVASTSSTLRVLTRQLKVGATRMPANTLVTVKRPTRKGHPASSSLVGYTVKLSGSAAKSGKALTLAANTEAAQPQPAEVFLGVVTGLTPTGLTLQEVSAAGGNDFGDDTHTLNVDTSAAGVSIDGTPGIVSEDEFLIVLGERDGDNVVAATVDAYTTPPDTEAGQISDISGTTITLGDEWGDDHGNDGQGNEGQGNQGQGNQGQSMSHRGHRKLGDDPTPAPNAGPPGDDTQPGDTTEPGDDQPPSTVDLTDVPVVLNGGSTIDVSALTTGEKIVVLGETDATTSAFTPQIAFAFNHADRRPASHHQQD